MRLIFFSSLKHLCYQCFQKNDFFIFIFSVHVSEELCLFFCMNNDFKKIILIHSEKKNVNKNYRKYFLVRQNYF